MHARVALAFTLGSAVLFASCGDRGAAGGGDDDRRALFDAERVPVLELFLDRGAMAELAREPRDWVRGELELRGPHAAANEPRRHRNVAVRFKGHRSLRSWADKPAFKLDFGKHDKGRRVFGLDGLVLNNMVEDPTMLRENLGARVYAALGVPAPRTGYAELFVNGERFGLYALLEPIDERFLAREFQAGDGPVYEGEYGCDVYEGDVWGFQHDGGEDEQRAQLLALARAVSGPPARWLLSDARVFDAPKLLGFLAAGALLGDFDGYRHAHNYRLYRDPGAKLWSAIPWGFDRILKKRLPVYDSNGRLARACFAERACRLEYVKVLAAAVQRFEALGLEKLLDGLDARIAAAVARDPRRPYKREKRDAAVAALREFVRERPAEVRAQLACWDGARELDRDGDGAGCMDCDDADPAVRPGAAETCNGKDDDCSGNADDAEDCACAAVRAGETDFELCNLPMTYWDARAFCEARGKLLARVDAKTIAKQLEDAAEDLRKADWWIGLDDLEREGRYRFAGGAGKPKRALWAEGEPDHHACGEHCAALKKNGRGKLRDLHCATPLPFICAPRAAPAVQEPDKAAAVVTPKQGVPTPAPNSSPAVKAGPGPGH